MKKYIFTFWAIHLFLNCNFCQGIRGGNFYVTGHLVSSVEIFLYTENEPKPDILFDWGDGTVDTLFGSFQFLTPNIVLNTFHADHDYLTPGNYRVGITDSFLIDDISNVLNSGQREFVLYDSLFIPDSLSWINYPPVFSSLQTQILELEGGAIVHPLFIDDFDWNDSLTIELIPFTEQGYSFPLSTDTILCNDIDCLVWDRPTETGTFAFGVKVTEYSHGMKRGTTTRLLVIEIDSVITSIKDEVELNWIEIGPNPADENLRVNFSLSKISEGWISLTVKNLLGQPIQQEKIKFTPGPIERLIDVHTWPPGLYLLSLEANGQVWTEKVVVQ